MVTITFRSGHVVWLPLSVQEGERTWARSPPSPGSLHTHREQGLCPAPSREHISSLPAEELARCLLVAPAAPGLGAPHVTWVTLNVEQVPSLYSFTFVLK